MCKLKKGVTRIRHIKTVEEARLLPEINDPMFEDETEEQPDGTFIVKMRIRRLYGEGVEGDDIMLFIDTDGITKKVVQTENGPAKTEWSGPF